MQGWLAYAAVAANTSLFVAVVKIDTATEKSSVNPATRNRRLVMACTAYKTAIEATGKTDAIAVVHRDVNRSKVVSRMIATSHFLWKQANMNGHHIF